MRLIDADALCIRLKQISDEHRYDTLFSDNVLSVEDIFNAIIDDLKGNSIEGYMNVPTVEAYTREEIIKMLEEILIALDKNSHVPIDSFYAIKVVGMPIVTNVIHRKIKALQRGKV